nr:MAG TPA: TRAF PROTEIN, TRAO PROTEIN, TRAN ADHESION, BACTERIAL SECRETION.5A [Caudoviricetes sp.]
MKIVLLFLCVFLLSACASQQPTIQNSCAEIILDDNEITDFDTCNKHRLIWKKAYETCKY